MLFKSGTNAPIIPNRPEVAYALTVTQTSPFFLGPRPRLVAFEEWKHAQRLWIKGTSYDVAGIFGPRCGYLAPYFDDCTVIVSRLAPQDYHRYACAMNTLFSALCHCIVRLQIFLKEGSRGIGQRQKSKLC
jgi:hypothetical protein